MPTVTLLEEDRRGEWDPLIGATVGSWRIARKLGAGGMGAVFLARHPGIGARVAIKFLHSRYQSDRAAVERFFNEARAVNLIGHENIVKILDFNVLPDGRRYFVMEFLEGRSLQSLLDAKQAVPLSVAGPIVLQISRALQAAHERGITHRDLKPENVFLVSQMGRKHFVKLVDFGIAKLEPQGAQQGGAVTETGVVMGTPAYMSPEQAAGRIGEIGRRSDVYSLGVVMYQLATGRVPFEGPSTAETLVKHLQERPRPPRELEQSVPAEYEAVILKALEKKREDRFQSMKELHDALRACMRALGVSEELPVDDGPPAPPELDDETGPVPEGAQRPLPVPGTQTSAGPLTLGGRVVEAAEWAVAPERRMKIAAGVLGVIVLVGMVGISREQKHAHEIDKA
ncbi:MAG: serine/threonine protein kinase, partial [Deltaproteobacteria bacterium]|nr:serine/threonine protein kinase [Deltaproteobacteria bacterium]